MTEKRVFYGTRGDTITWARIEVPNDLVTGSWGSFEEVSGIPNESCIAIGHTADDTNPNWWFYTLSEIPATEWKGTEIFDGEKWIPYPTV